MAWWISGLVVVLALIGLLAVLLSVVRSMRRLEVAMRAVQRRLVDGAHRMEPRTDQLRAQLEAMEPKVVAANERALLVQARRGKLEAG